MANPYFDFGWTTSNLTSHVIYKVLYRVTGTSLWTTYTTSGTTTEIGPVIPNTIYDIEVQNINNFDNAISTIAQAIGFTNPNPIISVTNSSIAWSFVNLSSFITSYTISVALASNPAVPLQTTTVSPPIPGTVIGSFSGLFPLTSITYPLRL